MTAWKALQRRAILTWWRVKYWWLDTPTGKGVRMTATVMLGIIAMVMMAWEIVRPPDPVEPQETHAVAAWIVYAIVALVVALFAYSVARMNAPHQTPQAQKTPTVEDGQSVKRYYGTVWVPDQFILAWKPMGTIPIKEKGGRRYGFAGPHKRVTVGYWYTLLAHWGIGIGPIDAFLEFRGGTETAWSGRLTESGRLHIDKEDLWGGEKDGGGIVGDIDIMFGEQSQKPNDYLLENLGGKVPAWRGMTTAVFRGGKYGAMNPYPQQASFKIERIKKGWDNDPDNDGSGCWYPEKAVIPLVNGAVDMLGPGWEYQVEHFTEPNTVWNNWSLPEDGWVQGGEMPFTTNGTSGGPYWTPMRSNIWIRRKIRANVAGLTMHIGGENGCVVFIDGVYFGGSNIENKNIPHNTNYPVDLPLETNRQFVLTVKGFAEINASNDAGNLVDITLSGPVPNAMNPAHVLYDARTNADTGREPVERMNDASYRKAADVLYAEGFGISTEYDPEQESLDDFEQRICNLIGGAVNRGVDDGKWRLDLARGNYDINILPVLTDDDILEFTEVPRTLDSAPNSVQVKYFNPETREDVITPPVQALAAVDVFGTISRVNEYPEVPTSALALRLADRDTRAYTTPARSFDLVCMRNARSWLPNTYFRLQAPRRGIADMVCLLGESSKGSFRSGAIKITATQDIYTMPDTTFVEQTPSVDTRPPSVPVPVSEQRLLEAPYIDVLAALDAVELAALDNAAGYLVALAKAPGQFLDYDLMVAAPPSQPYEMVDTGDWTPSCIIVEGDDRSNGLAMQFTYTDADKLAMVEVGTAALWDDEIVRVTALDTDTKTITLGRGCADTVPMVHAADSRLWFYQAANGADPETYDLGDDVSAKMLTNTSNAKLDSALAPAMSLQFSGRQARPYPPANVKISGDRFPSALAGTFTVTWAHRDRVAQAGRLVDTQAASMALPDNQRYGLRLLDDNENEIIGRDDIGDDQATITLDYTGPVTTELWTINNDGESLQQYRVVFDYTPSASPINEITADTYTPTDDSIVIDGGDANE